MKKYLFTALFILTPILSLAQASGGQIRRPNHVQQTEQRSRQHNNTRNNHEFVDLGLSVKWATCNIGASKPHEYGSYFAWGETKPKSDYSWKTYFDLAGGSSNPHLSDENYSFKKDDFVKYSRFTDLQFDKDCDAATVAWGSSWKTPSHEEFNELWTLSHEWACIDGVYGMKFTANNGSSIFLPAAGGIVRNMLDNVGIVCLYWMNELHEDDYDVSELAKMWLMDKEDGGWSFGLRCFGFSIRPVTK
jgi:hypothetical protein